MSPAGDSKDGHGRSPRRPLQVAVIGASEWAVRYHLPALTMLAREPESPRVQAEARGGPLPSIRLHGIWNRTASRAEEAAAAFAIPRVYGSLEELAQDDGIDCLVVLVSPKVLPDIVSRLLPRGLPIFTEKSPGWSHRQALELARSVTVPNVVGFNRRYMPLNRRFKQIVDGMSAPYFVECHFYRHDRLCEEFIIETGVHGINYLEHLCGPLAAVDTERRGNPLNGTYVWECRLEFASGLRGIAKFLPCSGSSVERYEVHANDLSAYLHSPQTYASDYPGRIILHRSGRVAEEIEGSEETGEVVNAGFLGEYVDFFGALGSGGATVSNFRNACSTMRAAEAIQRGESYRRGEPT